MREVWCERIQAAVPKIEAEIMAEAALPREKNPFREPKVLRKVFDQRLRRMARRLFLPLFLFGDASSRVIALQKTIQHNSEVPKIQVGMGSKLLATVTKAKDAVIGQSDSPKPRNFTSFYVRKTAFHERSRANNSEDELAERNLLFLSQSHFRLEDRYDHFRAEIELYKMAQSQYSDHSVPRARQQCHKDSRLQAQLDFLKAAYAGSTPGSLVEVGLGVATSGVLNSGSAIEYREAAMGDAWLKEIKFEEAIVDTGSTQQEKTVTKLKAAGAAKQPEVEKSIKSLPKHEDDKGSERSKTTAKKFISLSSLKRRFDITGGAVLI